MPAADPAPGPGAAGPRLLLGTRAGMTLAEVLRAVPGSVVYAEPRASAPAGPAVLAGHDDVEVAGIGGRARFGFVGGGLASVTLELDHAGRHDDLVFAVRQLVVLLVERLGRCASLSESPPPGAAEAGEGERVIAAAWRSDGVDVELEVAVRQGVGAPGRTSRGGGGCPDLLSPLPGAPRARGSATCSVIVAGFARSPSRAPGENLHMADSSNIVAVLRGRRSVGQPLLAGSVVEDHGVVREALESARWAPNHKRTEPWRFYLLDDERIRRLADMNAELLAREGSSPDKVELKRRQWAEVPGVVVFTVRSAPDADEVMRREDYAAVVAAAQNFMLHLWAEGVHTKWSTSAVWRHEGFWPLLGHAADPGEEVVGIFFYGRAAEVPAGRRRLSLDEVLTDFRR